MSPSAGPLCSTSAIKAVWSVLALLVSTVLGGVYLVFGGTERNRRFD